jgi:hypothetical protein
MREKRGGNGGLIILKYFFGFVEIVENGVRYE